MTAVEKIKANKENKSANLLIRLTAEEKALLKYEARKQGISTAQLIRTLIIIK